MFKEKIIKTKIIVLYSFFALLSFTFFAHENLAFPKQNSYDYDIKSDYPENIFFNSTQREYDASTLNLRDYDIFGIEKIYPTAKNGFEWFLNIDDPMSDPYLHNYKNIEKNNDGSYNLGDRSRMGVYSKDGIDYPKGNMETYSFTELSKKGYWYKPSDWTNVEITGEYLYKKGEGSGITHYARSEHHSNVNNGCGGSSYKLKIHFVGTSSINKEQSHAKAWKIPIEENPFGKLYGDWFRFKGIIYNLPDDTVKLESWLDPFLDNTWIKIAEYHDIGGWGKDGKKCDGDEDHIIIWGSPTATFRWDDVIVDFRNLSVREIQSPIL